MSDSTFIERYKNYTLVQLVEIIENRGKYQPAAVKAAIHEIEQRNALQAEIDAAKDELRFKKHLVDSEKRKKEELRKQIKETGSLLIDKVVASPVSSTPGTMNKTVISICAVFILMFILAIAEHGDMVEFMFTDINAKWDLSMMFYFEPLWMIPIVVVLFWMRKRMGWVLMVAHITYTLITGLVFAYLMSQSNYVSASPFTSADFIFATLLYGGTLYFLCTKKLKDFFGISSKQTAVSILLGLALFAIGWMSLAYS